MKKLALVCLATSMTISGCSSTTLQSMTGVDRKQFLMVSAEQVEQASAQSYSQTLAEAKSKGVLNTNRAQYDRVNRIANRLIAQVGSLRPDAKSWKWQVNVIKSDQINAYCAPGGRIMFYSGIIDKLQLTDEEIAAVMGHEIAHALREHGRERVSRATAQQLGLSIAAGLAGLSQGQTQLAGLVSELGVGLPHSRSQESEADILGVELMARAGYNPQSSITIWQKMAQANSGSQPQFLSTHPNISSRIANLKKLVPKVMPLYQQARG